MSKLYKLYAPLGSEFSCPDMEMIPPKTAGNLVARPKCVLRNGIPLLSRFAVPIHRLDRIRLNSLTVLVHDCHLSLSHGVSLDGRLAIPFQRFGVVHFNAVALNVQPSKYELRLGVSCFGLTNNLV